MDSQADLSLQRSRLYAAAGLLPPHSLLGGMVGDSTQGGRLQHDASSLPFHRTPGSAADAMSSLAQLQGRYIPDSLAYMHGGQGAGYSLMSQYFNTAGSTAGGSSASDHYKALQGYWPTHSTSHLGHPDGFGQYGMNAALCAPSYVPSLLSAVPSDSGAPYPLMVAPPPVGQLSPSTYHGICQLQKEMLQLQAGLRMAPPPSSMGSHNLHVDTSTSHPLYSPSTPLVSPSTPLVSPSRPGQLDLTEQSLKTSPSDAHRYRKSCTEPSDGGKNSARSIRNESSKSSGRNGVQHSQKVSPEHPEARNSSRSSTRRGHHKKTTASSSSSSSHEMANIIDEVGKSGTGTAAAAAAAAVKTEPGADVSGTAKKSGTCGDRGQRSGNHHDESKPTVKANCRPEGNVRKRRLLESAAADGDGDGGGGEKANVIKSAGTDAARYEEVDRKSGSGETVHRGTVASERVHERKLSCERVDRGSNHENRDQGSSGEHRDRGSNGEHKDRGSVGELVNQGSVGEHLNQGSNGEHVNRGSNEHKDRWSYGEHKDRGSKGEHKDQGSNGEHKDRESNGEHKDRGSVGEHGDRGSVVEHGDRGSSGEHRDRGSSGEHRDRGSIGEHRDRGSVGEHRDRGSIGEHRDRGSIGEHRDRDSKGEHQDLGPNGEHKDRGSICEHVDRGSIGEHRGLQSSDEQNSTVPISKEEVSKGEHRNSLSNGGRHQELYSDAEHKSTASDAEHKDTVSNGTEHTDAAAGSIAVSYTSPTGGIYSISHSSKTVEPSAGAGVVSGAARETKPVVAPPPVSPHSRQGAAAAVAGESPPQDGRRIHATTYTPEVGPLSIMQSPPSSGGGKDPTGNKDFHVDPACVKTESDSDLQLCSVRMRSHPKRGPIHVKTDPTEGLDIKEGSETDGPLDVWTLPKLSPSSQNLGVPDLSRESAVLTRTSHSSVYDPRYNRTSSRDDKFVLPIDPRLLQLYSREDQEKLWQAGLLPRQLMWRDTDTDTPAKDKSGVPEPAVVKADPSDDVSSPHSGSAAAVDTCQKVTAAPLPRAPAGGKDGKVIKPKASKDNSHSQGVHDESTTMSGTIPVGIAIARQRNGNTARSNPISESWGGPPASLNGGQQDNRTRSGGEEVDPTHSGGNGGTRDRDERGHFHREHKSLLCGQDRPAAPVTNGQDGLPTNLVLTGGASSNVHWDSGARARHPNPQSLDPWNIAPPHQSVWGMGQPPYPLPPPPPPPPPPHSMPQHPPGLLDPAHIPYSVPAGYKIAQEPLTGQVYLLPDMNWAQYQAAAASARNGSHPLLGCLPQPPSTTAPERPDPAVKKDSRPQSVDPEPPKISKPRPSQSRPERPRCLSQGENDRDSDEAPPGDQSLPLSYPPHLPYLYGHPRLMRNGIKVETQLESRGTSPFVPVASVSTGTSTQVELCTAAVQTGTEKKFCEVSCQTNDVADDVVIQCHRCQCSSVDDVTARPSSPPILTKITQAENDSAPTASLSVEDAPAEGLQMLCFVAEQEWGKDTAEPSPDINKNYNAPRASFFDSEDFVPLKHWPARKEESDMTNLLKINSGFDAMEPMEVEMRMRLAELQRKYREKQRQLAKLQPKKDKNEDRQPSKRGPGRPCKRRNKKSSSSESSPPATPSLSNGGSAPATPKKVKVSKGRRESASKNELSTPKKLIKPAGKPPVSSGDVKPQPTKSTPRKNPTPQKSPSVNKLGQNDSQPAPTDAVKVEEPAQVHEKPGSLTPTQSPTASENLWYSSPTHGLYTSGLGLLAQYATAAKSDGLGLSVAEATSAALKSKKRRKLPDGSGLEDFADQAPVKKRKPGRPKKFSASKGVTETLVARKYKHYSFLFMKAGQSNIKRPKMPSPVKVRSPSFEAEWNRRRSERIFLNEPCTPPKVKQETTPKDETAKSPNSSSILPLSSDGITSLASQKSRSSKPQNKMRTTPSGNKMRSTMHDLSQKVKKKYSKPTSSKTGGSTGTHLASSSQLMHTTATKKVEQPPPPPPPPPAVTSTTTTVAARPVESKFRFIYPGTDSGSETDSSSDGDDMPLSTLKHREEQLRAAQTKPQSCVIDKDDLKDKLHVLYLTDGLFYEGEVQEIQPPDVYGIIIVGERGNRPHIMSQEDLLKEAVLDVKPEHRSHIPEGTRVCAYWSQQFTCLYPGTISNDSPNPRVDDDHLVCVEFDDGDSGRIPLEYIRMLPSDFPVQDLDTIPLMMVGKRRRSTLSEETSEYRDRRYSFTDRRFSQGSADGKRPKKRGPGRPTKKKSSSISDRPSTDVEDMWVDVETVALSGEKEKAEDKDKDSSKREASVFPSTSKDGAARDDSKNPAEGKVKDPVDMEEEDADTEDTGNTSACSQTTDDTDNYYSDNDDDDDYDDDDGDSRNEAGKVPRKRLPSDSHSKIAAFLPARQLWGWSGPSTKRPGMKGRAKKEYFKAIKRGKEVIRVGDAAVFLSTGRPHLPYVGRITSLWQGWGGNMVVRVKWFYHPEETKGGKRLSEIKGALYQSPHQDENDVQTISHRCQVITCTDYKAYRTKKLQAAKAKGTVADFENDDVYYLAGTYDPSAGLIKFEADVKLAY